jgi:hypothetical protein
MNEQQQHSTMVRVKGNKKKQRSGVYAWLIPSLLLVVAVWYFVARRDSPSAITGATVKSNSKAGSASSSSPENNSIKQLRSQEHQHQATEASTQIEPSLISRDPAVKVTTDVRGNLGPPIVMIQENPGKDWIKDRWQAASDMHGTAIPGVHWVILEFPAPVTISKVILDWEAAFARDYRIEVSNDELDWNVLFDSHVDADRRTSQEFGQSPGVKSKTPLHIEHTVTMLEVTQQSYSFLRLYIRKSAMGWGVSLWQLDVYGTKQ